MMLTGFGNTRSLGRQMMPQCVKVPDDQPVIVIRDVDDRLICEWEPVEED